MQIILRKLILASFILFVASNSLSAQDCQKWIVENKKINEFQITRTKPITVVVRSSYTYSIELFSNEKGLFARMTSIGGIEFNQDDQVVFVDASGYERAYKFVNMGEVGTGSVPTYRNNLRLDKEAVEWLSANPITGINLVNFVDRQKHKFTINPNGQADFRAMVTCFSHTLDPALITEGPSAQVGKTPSSTTSPTTGTTASTGSKTPAKGFKPSEARQDSEVGQLQNELEKTKERLRNEIKAEKDKSEGIKAQLQQDVASAREASITKNWNTLTKCSKRAKRALPK